jgi:hypothetical protein
MAGYIFLLGDISNLDSVINNGAYSTNMKNPTTGYWSSAMEGTIADYMSMKEGDGVYFFSKRKIYGIGELVQIKGNTILENFPDSLQPNHYFYKSIQKDLLLDFGPESVNNRLVCFFKSAPYFFKEGVDMDDVLASSPTKFKMLRLIQQVSFIKIDDEENQALKDIILKRSLKALSDVNFNTVFDDNQTRKHTSLSKKVNKSYKIDLSELLHNYTMPNGALRHEMLVECAILYQLNYKEKNAINVFGEWDYLSHQVGASPFKPISYMDRMDVFGYAYIPKHRPTIERYLVVEIKSGLATKEDLNQLMKYVDWVKNEYAHNEYAPINAFFVAHEFENGIEDDAEKIVLRNYTYGNRPTMPASWANVKLITYTLKARGKLLNFTIYKDFIILIKV